MLKYKKVFDYITNSWVEMPFNTNPNDTEVVKIDVETWRKNGMIVDSEINQRSFTDSDSEEKDNKEDDL